MATEADKVNTGAMATILTVGALAMLGISAAVTALVRYEAEAHTTTKGGMANVRAVTDLRTAQNKQLDEPPHWANRQKALVGLPLDRAMKLVIDDLQRDPNSATPPPPDPKKKTEEEPKPEDELGMLEQNEGEAAAEASAAAATPEPAPAAAAADKPAEAAPKKNPASQPPAPAPAPGAPPAPAPEAVP